MKKRICRGMLLTLGVGLACFVLAAALIFRPDTGRLAMLLGVGLGVFCLAAALAPRIAKAALRPLDALAADVGRLGARGASLAPEEYADGELRAMAEAVAALSGAAAREHARTDRMLDSLGEGFVLLDGAQRVLLINAPACAMLETAREAALGAPFPRTPQTAAVCDAAGEALRAGGCTAQLPLPGQRVGEARLVRVPLEDAQGAGEGQGVMLVISDVTAEREADDTRRAFFEAASEVLRVPAENLKGLAQLWGSDMPLGGNKQEEISRRILCEAERLSALVGRILILSRLEHGALTFPREPLSLDAIVRECCEAAAPAAGQNGVQVSCEAQPCPISASRWEMVELARELLDNAVRYCPAMGRVEVALRFEDGAPCLRVFSTGEPLAPAHARHVFERFYRAGRGRGRASGGAGLGLAIVKHIASGYGASVSVEPRADGNAFCVHFPARDGGGNDWEPMG